MVVKDAMGCGWWQGASGVVAGEDIADLLPDSLAASQGGWRITPDQRRVVLRCNSYATNFRSFWGRIQSGHLGKGTFGSGSEINGSTAICPTVPR
jgi:hypothetical protein